jgi:hypothetical protein
VLKAVHVVYADWCPHCVPSTVDTIQRAARELGVPCVLHDIETDDGKIQHVMTGDPRGLQYTRQALEALVKGKFIEQV